MGRRVVSNLKVFIYALMGLLLLMTAGSLLTVFLADAGYVAIASILGGGVVSPFMIVAYLNARNNYGRGMIVGWQDEF